MNTAQQILNLVVLCLVAASLIRQHLRPVPRPLAKAMEPCPEAMKARAELEIIKGRFEKLRRVLQRRGYYDSNEAPTGPI